MPLSDIRKKIDEIDARLLDLLSDRAELVHQVGIVKLKSGAGIYAPEREEALLQSLLQRNRGRLPEKSVRAIYREIMSASLALEKQLNIAYPGPEASWSYQAARNKFGASVEYTAQESIAGVFDAVSRGTADYGVVPIESPAEGAVHLTLDSLMDSDLKICAQFLLKMESSIHDGPNNAIRSLVIATHTCSPTGNDKTSLIFRLQDKPGALLETISAFNKRQINMSKIESRPVSGMPGESFFFVDIEGHSLDEKVMEALDEVQQHCSLLKILGSYPRANNG